MKLATIFLFLPTQIYETQVLKLTWGEKTLLGFISHTLDIMSEQDAWLKGRIIVALQTEVKDCLRNKSKKKVSQKIVMGYWSLLVSHSRDKHNQDCRGGGFFYQ